MEAVTSSLVRQFSVKRIGKSLSERAVDTVAAEEPLEIRLSYWFKNARSVESLAITMRTPGHDAELAVGFLYAEGIIQSHRDIVEMRKLGGEESNEILIEVSAEVDVQIWRMSRATFVNSSCGVCGKRSMESLTGHARTEANDGVEVRASLITKLPEILRTAQTGFSQTGGLHGAAFIDANGEMKAAFEDIGRHNALDKLIGWALLGEQLPLRNRIIFLSSRSSFELVQKAATAGASVLATVGSPSSLAIESARQYGLTLIGFVRDERFNIYSGDWRINSS
ncbi:MAG: formate dehydrogenase accessory sulfurtransferase FdhD [Acidobacteriota bacterium]|nr:formate dehydrogenase accessory sulfurtransferase FdhD [Acidobacteriota bacterium]